MVQVRLATHDTETLTAIQRALDDRTPIALLHAKLPAAELARQRTLALETAYDADDAIVLFTSGSTGVARGVVLPRPAIEAAARATWDHIGRRSGDHWPCTLPLAHAGGLSVVLRCRVAGLPCALDGPATLLSVVPAQLADVTPHHGLRAVFVGGAAARTDQITSAIARGVPAFPTYGLTETFGMVATAREPGGPLVPLPGVDITGGTREQPARLRIRGPMLASRYLDGERIAPELVTSDLGYIEHGVVHVVGRGDDVIITGGENVHPTQVEALIALTPGVRDVVVFGVPDERWGQVVAAVVAASTIDERTLADWHARLPPFARPRRLAVVPELPRLPSGKLDRRAIALIDTVPIEYA